MKMFRVVMFGMVFAAGSVGIVLGQAAQSSGTQTQQASEPARPTNDASHSGKADTSHANAPVPAAAGQQGNEKQKKLAADTDKLLAMATDLKQQVDKTNKDVLSVDVIKKAEEIEKLARSLKNEMKQQ